MRRDTKYVLWIKMDAVVVVLPANDVPQCHSVRFRNPLAMRFYINPSSSDDVRHSPKTTTTPKHSNW
jgi:hypothetical protein